MSAHSGSGKAVSGRVKQDQKCVFENECEIMCLLLFKSFKSDLNAGPSFRGGCTTVVCDCALFSSRH